MWNSLFIVGGCYCARFVAKAKVHRATITHATAEVKSFMEHPRCFVQKLISF